MTHPRRRLSAAEVEAVCVAYSLGDPISSDLVHEGTSSLYRTVCASPQGSRTVAMKVQDSGEAVSAAKSLEAIVLSAIRPSFPSVPTLLRPGATRIPMRTLEWGLAGRRFTVSVYDWVDVGRPWLWTAEQRRGSVEALSLLQEGLDAIGSEIDVVHKAEFRPSILDIDFPGFVREFGAAERRRRQVDSAAGIDQPQLSYLDDRFNLVQRTFLDDWRHLAKTSIGLAHAEFTPGNCGYAENGAVTIVFDFESIRLGVLPLFGAITVGSFCLDRRAAPLVVVAAMREVVDGLRRSCPQLSLPAGLTAPLLRLAYLDAIRRQLQARKANPIRRWGFLKEDMNNLCWLDHHESLIAGI
jgi:hypothetical protein